MRQPVISMMSWFCISKYVLYSVCVCIIILHYYIIDSVVYAYNACVNANKAAR